MGVTLEVQANSVEPYQGVDHTDAVEEAIPQPILATTKKVRLGESLETDVLARKVLSSPGYTVSIGVGLLVDPGSIQIARKARIA